jgi:hypothetical protein
MKGMSLGSRQIAAVAAVVLVACSGPREGEEAVPSVIRLACEETGAQTSTPRVRAVRDGIHIEVDNRSGARQFYIRSRASDQNHGGRLRDGKNDIRTTMPPGDVFIGCFERGADVPYADVTQEFARITILDPDGLWIPPELQCTTGEQQRFAGGPAEGTVPEDTDAIIREAVPDVLPTDEIVRPGYPETQWHAEFRHVIRNGEAIASVSVFRQNGRWQALVRACPGSTIG